MIRLYNYLRKRELFYSLNNKFILIVCILIVTVFSTVTVKAEELGDFEWIVNSEYSSYSYSSIAFGNERFVAVGFDGAIKTSEDGIKWTRRESNTPYWLRRVVWTGKTFIAVGYGYSSTTREPVSIVLTSSDGLKWDKNEIRTESKKDIRLGGVACNGDTFVAVGQGGVCTSSDGKEWTVQKELGGFEDVVWANGKFVAVGYSYPDTGETIIKALVIYSDDGLKWTKANVYSESTINRIIWDGNSYIAVGTKGTILTSIDGQNWKEVKTSLLSDLQEIAYNGKAYVISGKSNKVIYSEDGKEWRVTAQTPNWIYGIVWANNKFIATGLKANKETFISSKDGVNWTVNNSTNNFLNSVGIGFEKSSGEFITQGLGDGQFMKSEDGMHWERYQTLNNNQQKDINVKNIAFNGSIYVKVTEGLDTDGSSGGIKLSKDGISWSKEGVESVNGLNSVIWDGKEFIAVGNKGIFQNSGDGMKWSNRLQGNMIFRDIAFNGKIYIAVGDVGEVAISNNGIDWDRKRIVNVSGFNRIIWNGKSFIAVGRNGVIYSTNDGIKWETYQTTTGLDLKNIIYEKDRYLLLGDGELLVGIPKGSVFLQVNGVSVKTDVLPITINDRTMVPVRVITESLGGTVEWDDKTQTIVIKKGDKKIELIINDTKAIVDGSEYILEVPAQLIKDRTLVPLRFIAENLGANINWHEDKHAVNLTTTDIQQ